MTIVIDLLLLAIFFFFIVRCGVRGFFRTAFNSMRLVLSVIIAYLLGRPVAGFLDEKLIYGWVYNGVYDKINQLYQSASESFDVQKVISNFPRFLLSDSMRQRLENMDESGESLVLATSEEFSGAISHIIAIAIAYLLVFAAAFILLWFFSKAFGSFIHRIPVVGTIDHILGAVLGLLIGWISLSLFCTLICFFFSSTEFYSGSHVLKFFAENPITKFLPFLDLTALLSKTFSK